MVAQQDQDHAFVVNEMTPTAATATATTTTTTTATCANNNEDTSSSSNTLVLRKTTAAAAAAAAAASTPQEDHPSAFEDPCELVRDYVESNIHRDVSPSVKPLDNAKKSAASLSLSPAADASLKQTSRGASYFVTDVVWHNVLMFLVFHAYAIYGIGAHWNEYGWGTVLAVMWAAQFSGLGVTIGAHRLWAHRAYKAHLPFRIVLMLVQTSAGQNSIYTWCRDHRMHHKYTETDADPHTTSRGMFFAHMGWLMMKKHPEVMRLGKTLDCSDLMADPVVRFQRRWFPLLVVLAVGVVPTLLYMWAGYSPSAALHLAILRYAVLLHGTWCVNSLAHWIGMKPYDKTIRPTEHLFTSFLTSGEGFHNYHHVFPFDYKAAELGFSWLNFSTVIINAMAAIGQAYDLKEASPELVLKRQARTGDGFIY